MEDRVKYVTNIGNIQGTKGSIFLAFQEPFLKLKKNPKNKHEKVDLRPVIKHKKNLL